METKHSKKQWQDVANLILGIWVIISPWAVGYYTDAPAAQGGAMIVGLFVVIMSVSGMVSPDIWEELMNLLLGTILVISPFALAFTAHHAAVWTVVLSGAAIDVLAVWSLQQQIGGAPQAAREKQARARGTITGEQSHAGR